MNLQPGTVPVYDSEQFIWFNGTGRGSATHLSSHDALGFFLDDGSGKKKAFLLGQIEDLDADLKFDVFRSDDGTIIKVARAQ